MIYGFGSFELDLAKVELREWPDPSSRRCSP